MAHLSIVARINRRIAIMFFSNGLFFMPRLYGITRRRVEFSFFSQGHILTRLQLETLSFAILLQVL